MKRSFCVLGLALCVGCATAVVRPYVGEQQNWPTASGSIVNTRYSLPVFTTLPPAPYDILAEMRIQSPLYAVPEEGHLPVLVKKAKQIGADALMFVEGQVYFAANYGSRTGAEPGGAQQSTLTQVNRFNPDSFKPGVNVVAIKWTGEPPAGLAKKETKEGKAPEAPAEAEAAPAPSTPPETAPEAPPPPPAPEAAAPPAVAPAPEASPAPAPEAPKVEQPAPPADANPPPATPAEAPKAEEPTSPPPPPVPANP